MQKNKLNTIANIKRLNDDWNIFDVKKSEYGILTNEVEECFLKPIIVKKDTLLYKYLRENTLKEDK